MRLRPVQSWPLRALLFGFAYYLVACFSLTMVVKPESISVFWPASGLLGVLLLVETRNWRWLLPPVFVAACAASLPYCSQLWMVPAYAVANITEACVSAWLLRRIMGRPVTLDRVPRVLALALLPALTGCVISATMGAAITAAAVPAAAFNEAWIYWWNSSTLGILAVCPAMLTWPLIRDVRNLTWQRAIEGALLFAAIFAMSFLLFASAPGDARAVAPLICLPFPLLAWAALRFGPAGVACASLLFCVIAVRETVLGQGVLHAVGGDLAGRILWLQIYLAVTVVSALLLAVSNMQRIQFLQRYRVLFESAGDIIFIVGLDGQILEVNRPACERLGYRHSDLVRLNIRGLDAPEYAGLVSLRINEIKAAGHAIFESALLRHDRTLIPVEVNARLIEYNENPAILALVRDISERKQAQDALQKTEAQLRQVQKMEAVGQLAGGIAHDFNNQLAGILGCAELLNSELKDKEQRRYVEMIVRSATRSADLTRQLLAFARKGKYQSVPVNMNALVCDVAALLRCSIDKRITIKEVLADQPAFTMGDVTQLQNALLNLGINARDALPGGGEIVFAVRIAELGAEANRLPDREHFNGRCLDVSVTDNGTGMSEEVKAHIFEPFFTTKAQGAGTGLGLAAVYGIVKSHKGTIDVASEPGRGSTFKLCLPLLEAPAAEVVHAASPAVKGDARILIVDDDETVRQVAFESLSALGYKVVLCKDGLEAIAYYREAWRGIDLVILDMVMPLLCGRETYIAMRQINPAIKAIMSSGYSVSGQLQRILDEGVVYFVQKPYRANDLARAIETALRKP